VIKFWQHLTFDFWELFLYFSMIKLPVNWKLLVTHYWSFTRSYILAVCVTVRVSPSVSQGVAVCRLCCHRTWIISELIRHHLQSVYTVVIFVTVGDDVLWHLMTVVLEHLINLLTFFRSVLVYTMQSPVISITAENKFADVDSLDIMCQVNGAAALMDVVFHRKMFIENSRKSQDSTVQESRSVYLWMHSDSCLMWLIVLYELITVVVQQVEICS